MSAWDNGDKRQGTRASGGREQGVVLMRGRTVNLLLIKDNILHDCLRGYGAYISEY